MKYTIILTAIAMMLTGGLLSQTTPEQPDLVRVGVSQYKGKLYDTMLSSSAFLKAPKFEDRKGPQVPEVIKSCRTKLEEKWPLQGVKWHLESASLVFFADGAYYMLVFRDAPLVPFQQKDSRKEGQNSAIVFCLLDGTVILPDRESK